MFEAWRLKRRLKKEAMILLLVLIPVLIEALLEIEENYINTIGGDPNERPQKSTKQD
jgi:hypothetical protein